MKWWRVKLGGGNENSHLTSIPEGRRAPPERQNRLLCFELGALIERAPPSYSAKSGQQAAKAAWILVKSGSSSGVGVCSECLITPFLSMTKAARALTEPSPIRSERRVP